MYRDLEPGDCLAGALIAKKEATCGQPRQGMTLWVEWPRLWPDSPRRKEVDALGRKADDNCDARWFDQQQLTERTRRDENER